MSLGRGLASLIPPSHDDPDKGKQENAVQPTKTEKIPYGKDAVFQIEVHKIKPNPHQPRKDFDEGALKDLAASIREFGIIQPLVVSKTDKETDFGADVEYQLIAGERRLKAAQMLGLERVPAIVRNIDSRKEHLELAVVENLQRENLNPIETGRAYAKLQDEFNLTQREIGSRLGKSRETVSNTMRLLSLPTEIQEALLKNQINESQARLLLAIEEPKEQQIIFRDLLNNNLSVRELKSRIRKNKELQEKPDATAAVDPEIKIFQEELSKMLGAKVHIKKSESGGQIIIDFYSPEEIAGIIKKIHPHAQDI